MIEVGQVILTDDIKDEYFVCDLAKCKGGCCVEGDLGAPLNEEELPIIDSIYEHVAPYLSDAGRNAVENQGTYLLDQEGEYSTPTINGEECAYAIYENDVLKCGIEKAWLDNKIDFKKPISCHLYPIRVTKYEDFEALNYDQWAICNYTCVLGDELKVPVYVFLKEALVRKYGSIWYNGLVTMMEKTD